jgi:hypothetical protein
MMLLAWRPFLDPLNLHEYWWAFLVPLALGVAFTYKAVRVRIFGNSPSARPFSRSRSFSG